MANASAGQEKIFRVLLVDDSPIALKALRKLLSVDPQIEVVGTARNGAEALELIPDLDPDVICTDLYMPVVDGLELTREVMDRFPRPILVISVAVREDEPRNAFDLLEAGALDLFTKPRGGLDPNNRALAGELANRIKRLAGVSVFRRPRTHRITEGAELAREPARPPISLVVIGASTGGPQALMAILPRLPEDFAVPIVCIQHIGEGFMDGLVHWLDARCRLDVKLAVEGETPRQGHIYFPKEGAHLTLNREGRLHYVTAEPVHGHRPSIDLMMTSVAEHFGAGVVGVLLSGMAGDGAEGLLAIRRAGGITLAQDAHTSPVFGMAQCAQDLGAIEQLLPLHEIAVVLREAVER